ncbi:DUF397 domain-containing protein [Streptomyces sp. NPDC000410]|uniref:DUF397 domain-containing protein n=1 Tax=Streptomyces sp. NPDC000410 TaxID=3154254 RepID=UPI00332B653D
MAEIRWQKSSYSTDAAGNCVELGSVDGAIKMRESDDPEVIVTTSPEKLRAFILGVKAGEFDHLI